MSLPANLYAIGSEEGAAGYTAENQTPWFAFEGG